jgi:hypothetical protein
MGYNVLFVDEDDRNTRPMPRQTPTKPKHETAVACTKLDDSLRRLHRMATHAPGHDGRVQHHCIEEPKVTTRSFGGRIVGRQDIEQFGFEATGKGHRN